MFSSAQNQQSLTEKVSIEMKHYLAETSISLNSDPLAWWKSKDSMYPLLAHLAKYYLSIPATSVPSERVFSTAGNIVNAQGSGLLLENVDCLIFLTKNLKVAK